MSDPLGLFDDEGKGQDPLGLFTNTPKTSLLDDVKISLSQLDNTADRYTTGLVSAAKRAVGAEYDPLFDRMHQRIKERNQWANPEGKEQNFWGKAAGTVITIPGQIIAAPLSSAETGQTMLEQGEKLSRAVMGSLIDTAGNMVGVLAPGSKGVTIPVKALTGAGVNAAQDTATKAAIAAISENQSTKDVLGPSWESAGLSGLIGAGMGSLGNTKQTKQKPFTPDFKSVIAEEKLSAVPKETISRPEPHQMELPDDGFIQAPQYGVMEGMSRIDENGMPIKADVSMEAQNVQNPRQMNLWGDELGPGLGASKSLTGVLDSMPKGVQRNIELKRLKGDIEPSQALLDATSKANQAFDPKEGPFSLPSIADRQRGAINMDAFNNEYNVVKRLPNGITLTIMGSETGPKVYAQNAQGEYIAHLKGESVNFIDPKATDNMESAATSVREQYRGQGIAQEMYKFLAEQGNDIVPGKTQTAAGKAMWDSFEKRGTAVNKKINAQRGALNIDEITKGIREFSGITPDKLDNIDTPRSQETITKKQELRAKALAISLKDSPYDRITTMEEALVDPGKDISNNQVRNRLTPGIASMVRHSTNNKLLNYARNVFLDARNVAEEFSKTYVTNKNGIAGSLQKASPEEMIRAHQIVQELSKQQVKFSDDLAIKLQVTPTEKNLISSLHNSAEAMLDLSNDAYMSQGFAPIKPHDGYAPGMFSGSYTTILRQPGEKGKVLVAQSDTKYGMNKAVEYYKQNYPKHTEIVELPRRGLQDTAYGKNRVFNGFNKLIQVIAENNPDFAEIKILADQYSAQKIKEMYDFDVHEKKKTGARGSLGDRPWLDAKTNAKEFWEGVINWAEEGSRYYAYQKPLNEVGKLQTNPDLQTTHKNTLKYLQDYSEHIQGKGLNAVGALGNAAVDLAPKLLGIGDKYSARALNTLRTLSSIHMMGLVNIGFFATQLTQVFTGGIPEGAKITQNLGLSGKDVMSSALSTSFNITALTLESLAKNKADFVPSHMRNAFNWAQQHGMFDFNEAVLAHDALKSKVQRTAETVATVPMWLGEQLTRPPVFMWYADMFHRAGFPEKEAFLRAQEATDYAMANYHPDERAQIYSTLGSMGQMMGALSTYKHNLVDQFYTRAKDVSKGEYAPALAMLGIGAALYGLSGAPGYQEADQLVKWLTNHSIREHGEKIVATPAVWDGALSAITGLDFNSRLSMASILPDDVMSTMPHISNTVKIISAGIDYASKQDQLSKENFWYQATPAGMRGMTEKVVRNDDGFVTDKNANRKYDVPRTDTEWNIRSTTGIRPLRERVTDERTFGQNQRLQKERTKIKDTLKNIESAIKKQDKDGVERHLAEYTKLNGDPSVFTQEWLQKILTDSKMSQKQRMEGVPGDSINSINRYKAYNE